MLIVNEKIKPIQVIKPTTGPPCSKASGNMVEHTIAIKPPAPKASILVKTFTEAFFKNKLPKELLMAETMITLPQRIIIFVLEYKSFFNPTVEERASGKLLINMAITKSYFMVI